MSFRASLTAATLALTSQLLVSAQNGRGPTLAERLQQHDIALTSSALVAALRSPDAEVRELAALKLAEDRAKQTIPSIEKALRSEEQPRAKVNLAFSLAQLGDHEGVTTLADTCHNAALKPDPRLLATRYMLDLNSDTCVTAVLDVLQGQDEDDAGYSMEALSLTPSFKHVSKEGSNRILASIVRNLQDPTPAVRLSAGDALASVGDSDAIPLLQNAIASEADQANRTFLEVALKKLQQKK